MKILLKVCRLVFFSQKHRLRDELVEFVPSPCASSSYSSPIERSLRFFGFAFWLPDFLFDWLDPIEPPLIDCMSLILSPLNVLRVIEVACNKKRFHWKIVILEFFFFVIDQLIFCKWKVYL